MAGNKSSLDFGKSRARLQSDKDKVTFENLDYKLLYTYCTSNYKNYKVYPFDSLTNEILNNHESIEQEYMNIVTNEVIYD